MENKEIETVAVLGEKRQSGLEGRSREEQPPGRVLFTLEDLKPLSRGKLRTQLEGETRKPDAWGKGREGGRNRPESSDGKPARTRREGLARRGVGTQAGPEAALEKLEGAGGWRAESDDPPRPAPCVPTPQERVLASSRQWAELREPSPGVGGPPVTSLPSGPGRGSSSVGGGVVRRWQLWEEAAREAEELKSGPIPRPGPQALILQRIERRDRPDGPLSPNRGPC